jgi:UPF0755 protein
MLLVFVGLVVMVVVVYKFYGRIYEENVSLETEHVIFYIPTGSDFGEVATRLEAEGILLSMRSFKWVADKKNYPENVKAGRYKIANGISNNELVNMLRSGDQDPVLVVFNNIRKLDQLAGKVSSYLEPDSASFADYLLDPERPSEYDLTPATFTSMFIPNTYEFFWNTSPEAFLERMKMEYDRFWNGERDRKAKRMEFTREEVVTLASIVDEETLFDEENARVAGLYLNRIKQGIPLQADPTLRFALDDFTIQRILNKDKRIDSPYNTYLNRGLPPGPISIPSVSAIDGVLDHEKHQYLYMCAKADFSGYHAFAKTLSQHNRNAREYQRELNKKRIYR